MAPENSTKLPIQKITGVYVPGAKQAPTRLQLTLPFWSESGSPLQLAAGEGVKSGLTTLIPMPGIGGAPWSGDPAAKILATTALGTTEPAGIVIMRPVSIPGESRSISGCMMG